jgi:hypothetical protein
MMIIKFRIYLLTEKGLWYTDIPEDINKSLLDVILIEENVKGIIKLTKISLFLLMNLNL